MTVDGLVPDADNTSLKRISVPYFDLRQSKKQPYYLTSGILKRFGYNAGRCATL